MTQELLDDANNDGITLDNEAVVESESTEVESSNAPDSAAELAPAPEVEQVKPTDGAQKAINKQHAKFREEERRANQLEKEKNELKDKLSAIEAERGEVVIPPMPDQYDADFDAQMEARDKAIANKATLEANKNATLDAQNANLKTASDNETARKQDLVNSFDSRIVKLGLNPTEVKSAVEVVVDYGLTGDIGEFILSQEDGPLITQYLASNPILLDELRGMSAIQAAFKIEKEVRPAAASLKPQASNTPDPAETLSGRGAGETVDPLIAGATFT